MTRDVLGPLGGGITASNDGTVERSDASPRRQERRNVARVAAGLDLMRIESAGDGVRYDRPFDTWRPLLEGSRSEMIAALGALAGALVELHAAGVVHGDLQPRFLGWRSAGGGASVLTLLVPVDAGPGEWSRALVARGTESLAAAAYVAPEVIAQETAGPAGDGFALAALIHRAMSGEAPLGQLDLGPSVLANTVRAALSPDPMRRPSVKALAEALAEPEPPRIGATSLQKEALRADAAQLSSTLLVLLALGGTFVFFGAIWLVSTNWSALGPVGHFALLLVLTAGAGVGGYLARRRGYAGTGVALVLLASRLIWADVAYVLDLQGHLDEAGAWSVAAAFVTACSSALLLGHRKSLFAWMTALDLAIFAGCFGAYLSAGTDTGPAIYGTLVAAVFSAAALGWSRLPSRDDGSLGLPFAILAVLAVWGSAVATLILLGDPQHDVFTTGWPILLGVVAAILGRVVRGVYEACARIALFPLLLLVPTIESLARHTSLLYLLATLIIGFGLLALRDRVSAILGVVNVVAAASLLFLIECWDVPGLDAATGDKAMYFWTWAAGAFGLTAFGWLAAKRDPGRSLYRIVEIAGLLESFLILTLMSLTPFIRDSEAFYATLLFVAGAGVLGLGLTLQRAAFVVIAAIELVVNLSFQYFLRLRHLLPTAVLIIGFGVLLLALGLAYERQVKRLLPVLRAWR